MHRCKWRQRILLSQICEAHIFLVNDSTIFCDKDAPVKAPADQHGVKKGRQKPVVLTKFLLIDLGRSGWIILEGVFNMCCFAVGCCLVAAIDHGQEYDCVKSGFH